MHEIELLKSERVTANQNLKEMEEICDRYAVHCNETKKGNHGKTAAFWINYLMHLYHSFNGSVKSGDFELYVSCFPSNNQLFLCDESC